MGPPFGRQTRLAVFFTMLAILTPARGLPSRWRLWGGCFGKQGRSYTQLQLEPPETSLPTLQTEPPETSLPTLQTEPPETSLPTLRTEPPATSQNPPLQPPETSSEPEFQVNFAAPAIENLLERDLNNMEAYYDNNVKLFDVTWADRRMFNVLKLKDMQIDNLQDLVSCSVCSRFLTYDTHRTLRCEHYFCKTCCEHWFRTLHKTSCPVCKNEEGHYSTRDTFVKLVLVALQEQGTIKPIENDGITDDQAGRATGQPSAQERADSGQASPVLSRESSVSFVGDYFFSLRAPSYSDMRVFIQTPVSSPRDHPVYSSSPY